MFMALNVFPSVPMEEVISITFRSSIARYCRLVLRVRNDSEITDCGLSFITRLPDSSLKGMIPIKGRRFSFSRLSRSVILSLRISLR